MKGACDCHVHVFGAPERYSFSPERKYTPSQASVDSLLELQGALGFERVVIVQASPYGTDNRCMLDALGRLGGRARGWRSSTSALRSRGCASSACAGCASTCRPGESATRRSPGG